MLFRHRPNSRPIPRMDVYSQMKQNENYILPFPLLFRRVRYPDREKRRLSADEDDKSLPLEVAESRRDTAFDSVNLSYHPVLVHENYVISNILSTQRVFHADTSLYSLSLGETSEPDRPPLVD